MKTIEIDGECFFVPEDSGDSWHSQRCPSCQKRNFYPLTSKWDIDYFVCGFCANNVLISNDEDFIEEVEISGNLMPEDGQIHYNMEGDEL